MQKKSFSLSVTPHLMAPGDELFAMKKVKG
jgi:hypothetical protein